MAKLSERLVCNIDRIQIAAAKGIPKYLVVYFLLVLTTDSAVPKYMTKPSNMNIHPSINVRAIGGYANTPGINRHKYKSVHRRPIQTIKATTAAVNLASNIVLRVTERWIVKAQVLRFSCSSNCWTPKAKPRITDAKSIPGPRAANGLGCWTNS